MNGNLILNPQESRKAIDGWIAYLVRNKTPYKVVSKIGKTGRKYYNIFRVDPRGERKLSEYIERGYRIEE